MEESPRDKFIEAVSSRIKDTEGCPAMMLIHTPSGLEIHANFRDFAMQLGLLDVARIVTVERFEEMVRSTNASGENAAFVKDIREQIDGKKRGVN
jgi:hypothetical protein